jgi:hypothetical protein
LFDKKGDGFVVVFGDSACEKGDEVAAFVAGAEAVGAAKGFFRFVNDEGAEDGFFVDGAEALDRVVHLLDGVEAIVDEGEDVLCVELADDVADSFFGINAHGDLGAATVRMGVLQIHSAFSGQRVAGWHLGSGESTGPVLSLPGMPNYPSR